MSLLAETIKGPDGALMLVIGQRAGLLKCFTLEEHPRIVSVTERSAVHVPMSDAEFIEVVKAWTKEARDASAAARRGRRGGGGGHPVSGAQLANAEMAGRAAGGGSARNDKLAATQKAFTERPPTGVQIDHESARWPTGSTREQWSSVHMKVDGSPAIMKREGGASADFTKGYSLTHTQPGREFTVKGVTPSQAVSRFRTRRSGEAITPRRTGLGEVKLPRVSRQPGATGERKPRFDAAGNPLNDRARRGFVKYD